MNITEYFVTVKYQVTDLQSQKKVWSIVSGMGAKPIELNVERELHPTNISLGKL